MVCCDVIRVVGHKTTNLSIDLDLGCFISQSRECQFVHMAAPAHFRHLLENYGYAPVPYLHQSTALPQL